MNSTVAKAELDTSFPDDTLEMDISGFGPPQGILFLACEARDPMNSTVADAELDFQSQADLPDEEISGFRLQRFSVFPDRRVWSSLAVVLFLHAASACVLWFSPKPHDIGRKWIEVQLVSMQGTDTAEPSMEQAPSTPANQAPPGMPPKVENPAPVTEKVPPPVAKSHTQPNPVPKKVERSPARPKEIKETKVVKQEDPVQTVPGGYQSEGSTQTAGTGAGASAAPAGRSVTGGKSTDGGGDLGERAFGAPDGPAFLRKVLPSYPALAKRLEKEGTVLLRVTIDERGHAVEVEVITKAGFGFDEEAVKAVQGSTFIPAKKEGKPLTCKALLPIRFVLKQS